MLLLVRKSTSDQGTFGILTYKNFTCFTGELPWHKNQQGISCVPPGQYQIEKWSSKSFPFALHLLNVKGREGILIHQGNFCGDTKKGFKSNILGCILVGNRLGTLENQKVVLSSVITLHSLLNIFTEKYDCIQIMEAF